MELQKMGFTAKRGQGTNKLARTLKSADERYSNEESTGNAGAKFELGCVQLVAAHGLQCEVIKKQGVTDIVVYLKGPDGHCHEYDIEVKSGSGIVATLEPEFGTRSIRDFTEADILQGVDFVIYNANPGELETVDELLDTSCVMSREAFIQMVCEAGGTRKAGFETCFSVQVNNTALIKKNRTVPARTFVDKKTGAVKTTKRGCPRWTDCIVMQTAYVESRAYMVRTGIKAGRIESLRTWLERNGRA